MMCYKLILSKQESAQFHDAVKDGKQGQGPRVFVRLPYTCHGIVAVQEGTGRRMLISVKVTGDPPWHFVQSTLEQTLERVRQIMEEVRRYQQDESKEGK